MPLTNNDRFRMTLAEGSKFTMNGRDGTVMQSCHERTLVIWDEWTNNETGEVHPAIAESLSSLDVSRAVELGDLLLRSKPRSPRTESTAQEKIHDRPMSRKELEVIAFRHSYVDAARALIEQKAVVATRASFKKNLTKIVALGRATDLARMDKGNSKRRAGVEYSARRAPESGETIHRWFKQFERYGAAGLATRHARCGNRNDRFLPEERAFFRTIIDARLTEERPSIGNIFESVLSATRAENDRRASLHPPLLPLRKPGYDTVRWMIAEIAPHDHAVRTRGMDAAYKNLHTLGLGLQLTRPLERVEVDEYIVDLSVFLKLLGAYDHLTLEEKCELDLDGSPQRLVLSAAIDGYTGCILAFQIARDSSVDLALRTVEMIYVDKQPLADAVGALTPWNMRGQPELIAVDRGNNYISDEFYYRLSCAGITNLGSPVRMPFLKHFIERFNGTLSTTFLQRFTGRTFSDVVKKGDNDPESRATLSLDEFLFWLTRWIVDVYHNTRPKRIGSLSPSEAWARALRESPPLVQTDERKLRCTFGVEHTRLVTRSGVRILNVQYQSDELAKWFLNERDRKLTVWWWQFNIGRIEVELPDKRLITVECTDPKWRNKTFAELEEAMLGRRELSEAAVQARDRTVVEIDKFTRDKAATRGLLAPIRTPQQLAWQNERFMRFMDTSERRKARSEAEPLFSGKVLCGDNPDEAGADEISGADLGHPTNEDDASDIWE